MLNDFKLVRWRELSIFDFLVVDFVFESLKTRSDGSRSRSCRWCPGWPPRLRFFRVPGAFLTGGLTISLEGGLEDVVESFLAFASDSSNSAIRLACRFSCADRLATNCRNSAMV